MPKNVFISHVDRDADLAITLSRGLEAAGITTWYYERDSVPGPEYLTQVSTAIENSAVVAVIISPNSLGSRQVTNEIVRAYEEGKPFVPLLVGITHAEFQQRRPEWRQALGASTSVAVPASGLAEIMKRVVAGTRALIDRQAALDTGRPQAASYAVASPGTNRSVPIGAPPWRAAWWAWLIAAALVVLILFGLLAVHGSHSVPPTFGPVLNTRSDRPGMAELRWFDLLAVIIVVAFLNACVFLFLRWQQLMDKHPWGIAEVRSGPVKGVVFELRGREIPVGRLVGTERGISIVGDEAISRRHGIIIRKGNNVFFRDCNSRLGSWIDEAPVPKNKPTAVAPGSVIRLGPNTTVFIGGLRATTTIDDSGPRTDAGTL